MMLLWVVTPCRLVGSSILEKHTVSVFRVEERDSMFLQNICGSYPTACNLAQVAASGDLSRAKLQAVG
jgi:hypothetical protein